MYQVFYQVEKLYQGEKYQVFEIFDFLAGWTLKFSAFGFRQGGKKKSMIGLGLSNKTYRSYHANFIYCTVVENSIWVLYGVNPQETLRNLLCNYYQCSNDSKVLIYHAALPIPSPIYDPKTKFVSTLHFLCTRFYVPGFVLYQVFFYQVFCLFWNVPGSKVPGI